jgi:hypothetical protein
MSPSGGKTQASAVTSVVVERSRPLLVVGDQQVERDAARQRALAVLAGHGTIRGAEAAQAIRSLPAEQRAHHESLPASETKARPAHSPLEWRRKPKKAIACWAACGSSSP